MSKDDPWTRMFKPNRKPSERSVPLDNSTVPKKSDEKSEIEKYRTIKPTADTWTIKPTADTYMHVGVTKSTGVEGSKTISGPVHEVMTKRKRGFNSERSKKATAAKKAKAALKK